MRTLLLFCVFVLTNCLFSCSKEEKEIVINYPDTGIYGENILRVDSIAIRSVRHISPYYPIPYSLYVELSEEAFVEIRMNNQSSDANAFWSYELSSKEGWFVIDSEPRNQTFKAFGPNVCDLDLTFYETGSAEIEIYENGEEEPSRVKTIFWHY